MKCMRYHKSLIIKYIKKKIQMKRITIFGATGKMGSEISKGLDKAGYELSLYARDNGKLNALYTQLNSKKVIVANSVEQAVEGSDILILALPYSEILKFTTNYKNVLNSKIIIDISNTLNETYTGLVTGWGTSGAEEIQKILPDAKIVKAFNTVFASRINNPLINGIVIDHLIAGNDTEAVNEVSDLIRDLGHNPIHAGLLEESRMLEHMAFLNISLNVKGIYQWDSSFKLLS
jgi:8-hydroxy-5-deazaflavin:NADPH oxidoreductase